MNYWHCSIYWKHYPRVRPTMNFAHFRSTSIILTALLGFAASCSTPEQTVRLIVTYAGQDARLERGGESEPVAVGTLVQTGDRLVTSTSPMDLQTSTGSVVRLRAYSHVEVANLVAGTSLNLSQGSLIARVERSAADEDFRVVTPTAIAGVRGTTFTIEEVPESGAHLVVQDGQVALRPRVRALEDPELPAADRAAIEQVLEGQEVVVGASEQATLDSQTVSVIERMNASEASNETPPALEELSAVAEPVRVQSAPIGLREQAEAMTLVQLDQELIERAADGQGQTDLRDELASAYTTERDAALDRLEEHASAFDLSSTDALRNEYQFLEVVNLRDETQVSGAVVAQAGDVLVVHTTAGIRRVRIPDVSYIDYLQQ